MTLSVHRADNETNLRPCRILEVVGGHSVGCPLRSQRRVNRGATQEWKISSRLRVASVRPDAEQRYLAVMAGLSTPPYRTAEVGERGYRISSSASDPRAGLLKKDLIWSPRRGQVDFTVPHFADYILRNHPLSDFDD
jgi:hypothetical protein